VAHNAWHKFTCVVRQLKVIPPFFSLALQSPWALASDFQFHDHFTDGRTPWMSDQLITRPLPKHRTTHTHSKHPCLVWDLHPWSRLPNEQRLHATDHLATVTGRLSPYVDEIIGDHQCWFQCNRSTTDQFFYIRQILGKKWEYNETVHQLFVHFKKAYDSVRREVLYNILKEFGYPWKLLGWLKCV
jgi:hypothetical protein